MKRLRIYEKEKNMKKNTRDKRERGITLIALVVTIVVLLILAGVSLNLVLGNNGIITKAQDAKLMTRAGSAEDEVELWKSDNYIARTSNQATVDKETMLQGLKDKNLVYEEEIDRDNEIITIKKKDGTIVKEINYSGVIINISKTPETEKSGAVVLQVTSVEGLTNISIKSEEEFNSFVEQIERMDEESKKDLIKNLDIMAHNKFNGTNITTFEELLEYYYTKGYITDATEEAYWEKMNDIPDENICYVMLELFYNDQTGLLIMYQVINPDNELSDTYVATENGTYTFIVKDLITGKSYSKSVEVTNIDSTLQQYYVANIDEYNKVIGLVDKDTAEPTTFSQAYIIYNGEKIDITSIIRTSEDNSCNYLYGWDIGYYMYHCGKVTSRYDVEGNRIFILVKDGIDYVGCALVYAPPPPQ